MPPAVPDPEQNRPTIGLFGLFDLPSLDHQVRLRVLVGELERRGARVRCFAPFGARWPIPLDGGEPVEAVFPADAAAVSSLTETLDAAVLCSDFASLAPPDLAASYGEPASALVPVVRLLAQGPPGVPVRRLPPEPHPALLAARVFAADVLALRLHYLRALGWWPDGAAVVVEAGEQWGRREGADRVVRVGTDPESDRLVVADAVAHGGRALPEAATVEDRVAAVAHAEAVTAVSPVIRALAVAFDRPLADRQLTDEKVGAEGIGAGKVVTGEAATDEDRGAAIDEVLDAVVADAAARPGGAAARSAIEEVAALRAALDDRDRRLATERHVLADYVRALRNNAAIELAAERDAVARLRRENENLRRPWRRVARGLARRLGRPRATS